MNKQQEYPAWQLKMEALQLKLNHASVMGDMPAVGKYNMQIDKIWERHVNQK